MNDLVIVTPKLVCQRRWNPPLTANVCSSIVGLIERGSKHDEALGYDVPLTEKAAAAIVERMDYRIYSGESYVLTGNVHKQQGLAFMAMLTVGRGDQGAHRATLTDVVMCPSLVCRELIRFMFAEILHQACALGVSYLELEVREDSRSRDRFESLGFRAWSRMADYARVDGRPVGGLFMRVHVDDLAASLGLS